MGLMIATQSMRTALLDVRLGLGVRALGKCV